MDERSRQRHFEDHFFAQLRARTLALTHGALPADVAVFEATAEGNDEARATLARLNVFDRGVLDSLPGTRSAQIEFQRRVWGGLLRKAVARLRVRTLVLTEALVGGQTPGPVGRERVLDALARYELLPRAQRPTAVVLASATGFTPEAKALVDAPGPFRLVLMGGREDGGWDVSMPDALRKTPWARLFELETQDERLRRVLYHLDQNAGLLDSRGMAVPDLAERAGLPVDQTAALVRQACRTQPRLMTVVHDGTVHVCRSPLAEEGETMSVWSRIRRMLGFKPSVAERVRDMTAQRVRLEQQRHELDQRLDSLEAEERNALQQGAAAGSAAEKKQIAGKLMRVRRDLNRVRAQASVFSQQIDILGTHVHHLTLTEQGKRFDLPKAEELTQEAAEAEQVLSELAANADLVAGIEVRAQTPMMAEEEAAILDEFEQVAASKASREAAAGPAPAGPAKAEPAGREGPPPVPERGKARPELG